MLSDEHRLLGQASLSPCRPPGARRLSIRIDHCLEIRLKKNVLTREREREIGGQSSPPLYWGVFHGGSREQNAGNPGDILKSWDQLSIAEWERSFNINFLSAIRIIRLFVPLMINKGWGRVVNIASAWAIRPPEEGPEYSASKAALINSTMSLSKALSNTGITVNSISPGPILTPRAEAFLRHAMKSISSDDTPETFQKKILDKMGNNLVGRFGIPSDVANLVSFLIDKKSDYITGTNLGIDGGYLLGTGGI